MVLNAMEGIVVLGRNADDGANALMEAVSANRRRHVRWIIFYFWKVMHANVYEWLNCRNKRFDNV